MYNATTFVYVSNRLTRDQAKVLQFKRLSEKTSVRGPCYSLVDSYLAEHL